MDARTSQNKLNTTARDLQSRLIAPCFVQDGEQIRPDVPALFRRLLLFETYILQTVQFKEFVPLGAFGSRWGRKGYPNRDLHC